MKKNLIYGMLLCLFGATAASCSDDQEVFFEDVIGEEDIEVVHPNERDKPYPREEHELYVNPAPLIVPESTRGRGGDKCVEFELSQNESFPESGTFRSGKLAWNMYNIHQQMATGTWYWRYRIIDENDKAGVWSEVNKFTVTGKEPVFVTPAWENVVTNIPTTYPRVHYYLNEDLERVRPTITEHEEYRELTSRANTALNYTASVSDLYNESKTSTLSQYAFDYLYSAYLLTGDVKFQDKLLEYGHALTNGLQKENLTTVSNFHSAYAVTTLSTIYDACQERLSEAEKTTIEEAILYVLDHFYNQYRGYQETHVFDNHTWQIVLRALFQGAFVLCQEYPEAMTALEYFYELWTARAPASGFNRDGGWINGTGYFDTNAYTLYYMPMLLSRLTGTNFLEHPWYKNVGSALVYSWLPETYTTGFGDIGNPTTEPYRVRIGFADFIASELNDASAAWYVKECNKTGSSNNYTLKSNYDLRLYRMARSKYPYGDVAEPDFENYVWYKDMGEGVAYSDMVNRSENMSLSFRSSPFGSGSHTLADQNSFKLLYKGTYVYMNAGYYQNFSDAHSLLQYRNTRGHNTIMINNIGQPFTTRAYGNISRGLNGKNIAYFLGDASHAYCGTSEYSMWQEAFETAGLSQTPEYGFGETPLNNYKRHIFMLRPNKVVIYDDLGADEPATWQWLLHSPVEFNIAGNKITTHYEDKGGFTSVAQIYSNQTPEITKTNEWFPGGEPSEPADKQWHLTANFGACQNNRILTIIQLSDDGTTEDIWQVNNTFIMGDWTIEAEMDANSPAAITISNSTSGCVFSYGPDAPMIDGTPYQRQVEGSSVLYDVVGGSMQVQEISDKPVQITRSVN